MTPFMALRPRRWQVPRFVREIAKRHPEFRGIISWDDGVRIAQRENVTVRVLPMPAKIRGRLSRIEHRAFIVVNANIPRPDRTQALMHELCHFWRDDPGEPCLYADYLPDDNRDEEFADVFAWVVCSPERYKLRGFRPEDR